MLKLAWRNLWRNRTRTLITISAIALTYSVYLMLMGIQEYTYAEMETAAANAAGGAVLIQGAGYQANPLNDIVMLDGDAIVAKVKAAPGVEHVASRVLLDGLLSTSASAIPVRLRGVDPAVEKQFQDLTKYLTEGTLLGGDESDPIVLGSGIVSELELQLGDRVILSVNARDGEMRRALFHLTGILHTNSRLTDKGLALTTIEAARKSVDETSILTQIGVIGEGEPAALAAAAKAALGETDGLEVLTWQEAMPDLVGFIEMDRSYGALMAIIIFLVVWFAIMNTFLMVVMERVRELGLLTALGLSTRRIGILVLSETFLLAGVALAFGLLVGFIGHSVIASVGIDPVVIMGAEQVEVAGIAMSDGRIRSVISISRWINVTFSVLVMVLLSGLYPAYKAVRMQPADAMRFYE